MSEFSSAVFWTALISGAILAGMPLLLGGLGETIAERAGLLTIGLEGYMLFGGYVGFGYNAHPHLLKCPEVARQHHANALLEL